MANAVYISIQIEIEGDGSTRTATIVLDATPFYRSINIINYKAIPDRVELVGIRDVSGHTVPASAVLSHSGKQIIITFIAPFTGKVQASIDLLYDV